MSPPPESLSSSPLTLPNSQPGSGALFLGDIYPMPIFITCTHQRVLKPSVSWWYPHDTEIFEDGEVYSSLYPTTRVRKAGISSCLITWPPSFTCPPDGSHSICLVSHLPQAHWASEAITLISMPTQILNHEKTMCGVYSSCLWPSKDKVRDTYGKKKALSFINWFVFKWKNGEHKYLVFYSHDCLLSQNKVHVYLRRCKLERTFVQQYASLRRTCLQHSFVLGSVFWEIISHSSSVQLLTFISLFSLRLIFPHFKITMLYSSKEKLSSILKKIELSMVKSCHKDVSCSNSRSYGWFPQIKFPINMSSYSSYANVWIK